LFSNGENAIKVGDKRNFKSLSDSQIQEFNAFINDNLKSNNQNIYILSHLPIEVNPESKLLDDPTWKEEHVWKEGKQILELLKDNVRINILMCFAGDGHVVESYKRTNHPHFFFLTGRFNGPIEKYGKLRDKETPKEASCQFIRVDTVKKEIVRTIKFSTFQESYEQSSFKWYSKSQDFIASTKYLNKFFTGTSKQDDLSRDITNAIGKDKLYHLAKATTKRKNVSLGWIDINGLLNHDNILKRFLEKKSKLLYKKNNLKYEKI